MGFDFKLDDATGALEIVTGAGIGETSEENPNPEVNQPPKEQPVDNRFVELDNRFNTIEQNIAQQNKTLGLIAQYLQTGNQVELEQRVESNDDEALGEIFQDVEKGKSFINNLIQKVTQQVEAKLNPMIQSLNPIVAESTMVSELRQFASSHADLPEYLPAMKYLLSALPNANLDIAALYTAAKTMGLKSVSPSQQRQNNNVTNINRTLPDKIDSSNAQLNNQKEPQSIKEALNQAMDELGLTG